MNTIDHRMESFVGYLGEVPRDARRLADFEAQGHRAPWLRRLLGKGICSHVIGYTHADRWWTYCFERLTPSASEALEEPAPVSDDAEVWSIEAYDSSGHSWTETFCYDALDDHWRKNEEAQAPPATRPNHVR